MLYPPLRSEFVDWVHALSKFSGLYPPIHYSRVLSPFLLSFADFFSRGLVMVFRRTWLLRCIFGF